MAYLGDIAPSQILYKTFTTVQSTGAPYTLASGAVSVYKSDGTTQSTSGVTLTADFDSVTGLNMVKIDTSADGTFYAAGADYSIVLTAGTVNSVSVAGYEIGHFSINNRTALRPTTAGRTLVVDANGLADANAVKVGPTGSGTAQTARDLGASVLLSSGTGTGQLDFTSGVVKANATQVAGTAQTAGDLYPAITGIGTAGGAAINQDTATDNVLGGISGVTSGQAFAGTQSSGTYASTSNVNGIYHTITGTASGNTAMDIVYQFLTGSGTSVVQATWIGYVTSGNDTITISAWRHDTGAWEAISSIVGTAGTTQQTKNVTLYSRHRGTSTAELGKVYLRLHCTGMTTPVVATDQIIVSYAVTSRGTYSDGAVWLNTAASNTNTQNYVDGLPENPVSTIAAAITIADSLKLKRIRVANGSSVTLGASMANRTMIGRGWTLALGGQAIDGAYFEGATVSGIGTCTTQAEFVDCHISAGTTVGPSRFLRSGFAGSSGSPFTAGSAGQFLFVDCYSEVAGSGTPYFTLAGANGINFRRWSGGSNITLDNTGTSITMEVVTGGGQTIAVGGADVEIRGFCRAITLTGITSDTVAQFDCVTGNISLAGADGTVNIYGVCAVVTDSRTGSPTLSNKALSQANPVGSVAGDISGKVLGGGASSLSGTGIIAELATGQLQLKKNTAFTNFKFVMFDSADHITPKTGLTITATRCIDGGSFASCANSASEIASGVYKISLDAADLNGTDIMFLFTATGADPLYIKVVTQA